MLKENFESKNGHWLRKLHSILSSLSRKCFPAILIFTFVSGLKKDLFFFFYKLFIADAV